MSDTPRVDNAAVSREFIAREMDHYAHKFVLADFARQLERELAQERQRAQNAEGMADCMRMVRDELVEAGIIDPGVAPMFIPEAIAGKLAEARNLINDITGPLVLCGEAEVRDVEGFRQKIIAMREAMVTYRQELGEARRELEVWSRRYADLEVLYLAATKS